MDQCITTLLKLDGWEVTAVEETARGWQVTVDAPRPARCPHCREAPLHRHETFARAVPHLWVGLQPLTVTWVPRRWRCAACRRTVCPRPAHLRPWQRWTNGLIEGYHTKIKQLKRLSYGFRNRDRYRRKMLLGFLPSTAIPQLLT